MAGVSQIETPPSEEVRQFSQRIERMLPKTVLRVSILLDLAIIIGVALVYAWPILNFDEAHIPSATSDWEALSAPMTLARRSILEHFEFPLWNPYFGTGIPFMGEPRTYLLNPLASVPALVLGTLNGSKVTGALSVIGAGLGMYYLAAVLGISRPFRVWSALMMAMSGSLAARIWAGHFSFVIGFPFVPFAFAFALQALRQPGVIYPMLAGVANSLLFFSGHFHYTVFAMPGLIVTFVFVFIEQGWRDGRWSLTSSAPVLVRGLVVAGWTLGFSAIQLLPQWESGGRIWSPAYDLSESQTLFASALNFFTADRDYLNLPLLGRDQGRWWEYYNYVGFLPLIGLALVVVALRRPAYRSPILWAATLFGLYLAWAAAAHTFWKPIYDWFPMMTHLRLPTRTLAFALPFLIILAALGLSNVTNWLTSQYRWRLPWPPRWNQQPMPFGLLAAIVLMALCFYSLRHVFQTNQALLAGSPRRQDRATIVQWLRERDDSVFYLAEPDVQEGVPHEFFELGIKRLDAWWVYAFVPSLPPPEPGQQPVSITLTPKYLIPQPWEQVPADGTLIFAIDGRPIYHRTESPYYAATFSSRDPPVDPSYAWRVKTQQASARIVSANVIEVVARTPAGHDRLLMLESFYPGWRLEVDGRRVAGPDNYGGFLSTEALPGEHTYTFVFDPQSFRYGAAITIGTVLGAILLLSWRAAGRLRERRQRSAEGGLRR